MQHTMQGIKEGGENMFANGMKWSEWKKQQLLEKGKENWDVDDYEAMCYIEECEAEDARDNEYLGNYLLMY